MNEVDNVRPKCVKCSLPQLPGGDSCEIHADIARFSAAYNITRYRLIIAEYDRDRLKCAHKPMKHALHNIISMSMSGTCEDGPLLRKDLDVVRRMARAGLDGEKPIPWTPVDTEDTAGS